MQSGGMDLSGVGEKILSSVRSARSLGLLQSTSDRPEVSDRAAAAAAVAHMLVGLPPYQKRNLPSVSKESNSIYRGKHEDKVVEVVEDVFYQEEFDPMTYVLMLMPEDESELSYFEQQANLRLAQLDEIAEQLSHHVMEHYEKMVKGMNLVRELEKDLKTANVICMNGRRHLASSMNEVSRDLIVSSISKKKQALLDLLRILHELRRALEVQSSLEIHIQEGNYNKAFQILPEYLQILDSFSNLSAVQEMSIGIEIWLGRTLEKLDSVLLEVCQEFNKDTYITVIEAYSLMGDVRGLSEKIQSYFMQQVLSETHSVLQNVTQGVLVVVGENQSLQDRFTYSDLCLRIPDLKFRQCLLKTLAVLFKLITSYYSIMDFETGNKMANSPGPEEDSMSTLSLNSTGCTKSPDSDFSEPLVRADGARASTVCSFPWHRLRKEAASYVSRALHYGRNNLWQLMTTRVSVLLSSAAVYSISVHQFLRNYEDLNTFILAGEAFCGAEAFEFRRKLKNACENYFGSSHRQNMHALQLVLENESWVKMGQSTMEAISFAGLLGDGAPLIVSYDGRSTSTARCNTSTDNIPDGGKTSGFSHWIGCPNPFQTRLTNLTKEYSNASLPNGTSIAGGFFQRSDDSYDMIGGRCLDSEDESEDLLADFIDEDSQLPSRISKTGVSKKHLSRLEDCAASSQTGSSLYLLRLMDKYARLMQRLEIINLEFFKGICQLFQIFFYYVYETFGQHETYPGGKSIDESLNHRLKTALSRISQDCSQWIRPKMQSVDKTQISNSASPRMDVTPSSPRNITQFPSTSFTIKERCAGAETLSLTAQILNRSKSHLQSMLFQNNLTVVNDFYTHLVDVVPDLVAHIHKTSAVLILHINGYVDRISNARWELKELGLEHNGYVDLLLGEFKHYKTRLTHGGIQEEVQRALVEYGMEIICETLVEGLSRVKRCTDEGRALMSLDLQVLINGLRHFTPANVKPELQPVDTFIKAYYLPETEFVHWARTHPEYNKSQVSGLINLVATMKGWKRKTRLEVIEKISTI